jgi:phosphoesterase RecJ-like protein
MKDKINYIDALNLIKKAHYILIVTHSNPDADTISCGLALSNYFNENKIKHKVFNKDKILPLQFNFLHRFDKIIDKLPKYYDLVIYVDCGSKSRVGIDIDENIKSINIDHHQSNNSFATINLINSNKSSSSELIYEFFQVNNLNISKQTALCIYTGIYDDSLKFSTPRCDKTTFDIANKLVHLGVSPNLVDDNLNRRDSLAKYRLLPKILDSLELHNEGKVATIYLQLNWLKQTGALYNECEDTINMVLNIAIVDIAIYFRVLDNKIKISLRGKNNVDVLNIATHFNGGGHKMSAGCTYPNNDILEAKKSVLSFISNVYKF